MSDNDKELLRDGAAYVDQWMAYQQDRRDLPGLVVAIQAGDEIILSRGYGYANIERREPMTPRHLFRVASHSKTFTATAIMQLVEQQRLRLDDPLVLHIPWLGEKQGLAGLTVRQALNHASGLIRDGVDADYWQLDAPFPDAEGLRLARDDSAVLAANEGFKYSNIGYALLGLVVEAASGLPYNDYVRRHIVERLGLSETGPETDERARERLVTGYTARRLGMPRRGIPDVSTRALSPATGFYASGEDLCRYGAAHFLGDDRLLGDAAKREMQQPYWAIEQSDEHYGLGLSVVKIGERRLIGHGGAFPGHATRTLIDPRGRLVVTVLVNEIRGPADVLARAAVAILDLALRQQPRSPERAPDGYARYTGRIVNLWGVVDVAAFGETLVSLNPEGDDPFKGAAWLSVRDAETLRMDRAPGYGSPGETLRYERDEQGHVRRVVIGGMSHYPPEVYRQRGG